MIPQSSDQCTAKCFHQLRRPASAFQDFACAGCTSGPTLRASSRQHAHFESKQLSPVVCRYNCYGRPTLVAAMSSTVERWTPCCCTDVPAHQLSVMYARNGPLRSYIYVLLLALVAGCVMLPAASQPAVVWDAQQGVWIDPSAGTTVMSSSSSSSNGGMMVTGATPASVDLATSLLPAEAPTPGLTLSAAASHTSPQMVAATTAAVAPSAASIAAKPFDVQGFQATCGRTLTDSLTQVITGCGYIEANSAAGVSCQQLSLEGRIGSAVQSFSPPSFNGNFTVPIGCGNSMLVLSYDNKQLAFYSQNAPVLAAVAKEADGSKYFIFGSGVSQGKISAAGIAALELCLVPASANPLSISQSASYSLGLASGNAEWGLKSTAQLPDAYSNGLINMFSGDSVDVAWTLAVTKTGRDTTYQGMVTGQIMLSNNQQSPLAVYSVTAGIMAGPVAQIKCQPPPPFRIPGCASVVCTYVAYYPQTPAPGNYQTTISANYQVEGVPGIGLSTGAGYFQVTARDAGGYISSGSSSNSQVPEGQAVVIDTLLPPGQNFKFKGSGRQSYVTTLKCPAAGTITNNAMLTASTGQEVASSASITKNCFDLTVRLGRIDAPFVASYVWKVDKTASISSLRLRGNVELPGPEAFLQQQRQLAAPTGQNYSSITQQLGILTQSEGPLTAEVTYAVKFTREAPSILSSGGSFFSVSGTVTVLNPAPINAKLAGVSVSVSNPTGKTIPYVVDANCPVLTVGSGQTLTCTWEAKPQFNPSGGQVSATARYINTNNGLETNSQTHDYTSAPSIIGSLGKAESNAGGTFSRRLSQWNDFDPMSFLDQMWGDSGSSHTNTPAAARTPWKPPVSAAHSYASDNKAVKPARTPVAAAAAAAPRRQAVAAVAARAAAPTAPKVHGTFASAPNPAPATAVAAVAPVAATPAAPPVAAAAPVPTTMAAPVPFTEIAAPVATKEPVPSQLASQAPAAAMPTAGGFGASGSAVGFANGAGVLNSGVGLRFGSSSSSAGDTSFSNMGPSYSLTNGGSGISSSSSSSSSVASISSYSSMRLAGQDLPGSGTAPVAGINQAYPMLMDSAAAWQAGPPENTSGVGALPTTRPYPMLADISALPVASSLVRGSRPQDIGSNSAASLLQAPAAAMAASVTRGGLVQGGVHGWAGGELPSGLLDECIEVSDAEGAGPGTVKGKLSSGQQPIGRICSSTTFVYNIRYGPFGTCSNTTKATNTAAFVTKDSKTAGRAMTEVAMAVYGCGPPLIATLQGVKAVADAGYKWSIETKAATTALQVPVGVAGNNTYTTSIKRTLVASNPKLNATLLLKNPESTPVTVIGAIYTANATCSGKLQSKRGTFNCSSSVVPGFATVACSFAVPLQCLEAGVLGVSLLTATGKTITAGSVPFATPSDHLVGKPRNTCVTVTSAWRQESEGQIAGAVINGALPTASVCDNRSFSFTAQYGPFHTCQGLQAINTATATDAAGSTTQAVHSTSIQVTGCSGSRLAATAAAAAGASNVSTAASWNSSKSEHFGVQTSTAAATKPPAKPAAKAPPHPPAAAQAAAGGPCVHVFWFWRTCLTASEPDAACSVIERSLPGGASTPFFQLKHATVKRTYRSVLLAVPGSGSVNVSVYMKAAQAYVAAQLNQVSGAVMPAEVRQAQVFLATKFFSVFTEKSSVKPDMQQKVAAAVAVLSKFNNGKFKGLPSCNKLAALRRR